MNCCIPIAGRVSIPIPQKYLGEVEKALVTAFVVDIIINYSVPLAIIRILNYEMRQKYILSRDYFTIIA